MVFVLQTSQAVAGGVEALTGVFRSSDMISVVGHLHSLLETCLRAGEKHFS